MSVDWLARRITGYAHQGGALEAPASSMFAMSNAKQLGLGGLELDVHRSSDGVLVVFHDDRVDRTTAHRGLVSRLTWDELSKMDNAYWYMQDRGVVSQANELDMDFCYRGRAPFDQQFAILRFDEVLDSFPQMLINVDIKNSHQNSNPYEHQVLRELEKANALERTIIASFNELSLAVVREELPEMSTSAGPSEISEFYFALRSSRQEALDVASSSPYVAFQIPRYYGEIELATKEFIDTAHEAGKAIHVWTIDDANDMNSLIDLGIDAIMSDRPSVLAELLRDRGISYNYMVAN